MGTRSLTHVYESASDSKPLVTIYRQYDGHPESMGEDIKTILGSRKLVNGYSDRTTQCNGMGCAAAMLIGGLKNGECGNVYLYPAGSSDCGEEYVYRLYPDGNGFRFKVEEDSGALIYDGSLAEYDSAALV